VNTEIVLVRHGKTAGNDRGLLHGRTDLPLADAGIVQARQVAGRLQRLGDVSALFTSPLQRARRTADIISQTTGLPPRIDAGLREFDFGDLEGVSFDDLQDRYPEQFLNLIEPDRFGVPFPNGESRREIYERVSKSLDEIVEMRTGQRIVIVGHLIVIAAAVARLTTDDPNQAINYLVENCSVTRLTLDIAGYAEIVEFNDVAHLERE
jgi:broad specificity phosphatase PhoE